ncbi:uncharacterized protein LOC125239952 isoform X4 [Leguminivora glycinivorella]|uniref:uncharacterized protein LOC125239952 isoform X4 n=1 Tax=Leguminivora glycinivorella TaxID=1035111 RepID=UPI0020104FAC|nr:uncharacterized protein LOC125239952 isoform X4 [Leguminivora glycinivorella]
MESINQCHCCLQRPPAKDLRTPYTHLGITEIYSLMIEECFEIKLRSCDKGKGGICTVCVCRLREACVFKMQVQSCQDELQERLDREEKLTVKDEKAIDNIDELSDDGALSEPLEYPLSSDEELPGPPCKEDSRDKHLLSDVETEPYDDVRDEQLVEASLSLPGDYKVNTAPLSPRAVQKLSLGCFVKLERLRDSPRASLLCPVTSHREPSPVTSHREPSPVTSHRESQPCPVTSDRESQPCPVTSHRESQPCPVTSDRESQPCPVTSHRESQPCPVTSHREPSPVTSHFWRPITSEQLKPTHTHIQAYTHDPAHIADDSSLITNDHKDVDVKDELDGPCVKSSFERESDDDGMEMEDDQVFDVWCAPAGFMSVPGGDRAERLRRTER